MDILKLWQKVKPHVLWISLLVVALLYGGGHYLKGVEGAEFWSGAASQLAATILTGGIFASLLKSYQFIDVFKDELRGLFRETQFIESMKNIVKDGVTGDETLGNAFARVASLSSPALEAPANKSFSSMLLIATDYSLRSYKRYIRIVGYDPVTKVIQIHDEVQCEVVVGENDTTYRWSEDGLALATKPTVLVHKLQEHNGSSVDLTSITNHDKNSMSVTTPVKKAKTYGLTRIVEKKYPLFHDPNIHQQFKRFCHGLALEIENQVPDLIGVDAVWVNFEKSIVRDTHHTSRGATEVCKFDNPQLTFPYQGFILTLSPKI